MVRAILDGRKTQTRRIIKPQPKLVEHTDEGFHIEWSCKEWPDLQVDTVGDLAFYGLYKVGDRLWVKEGYSIDTIALKVGKTSISRRIFGKYLANNKDYEVVLPHKQSVLLGERKKPYGNFSSHFMYKSLARIFLEITGLRVERAQDITPADCELEGLELTKHPNLQSGRYVRICKDFESLWDSLNAKRGYGWDKNPWVWVIEWKQGR